jgi:hypothetical protein
LKVQPFRVVLRGYPEDPGDEYVLSLIGAKGTDLSKPLAYGCFGDFRASYAIAEKNGEETA